ERLSDATGSAPSPNASERMNDLVKSFLTPVASQVRKIDTEVWKIKRSGETPLVAGSESGFSESDFVSIHNAGLVLLWPFLPRFFENMSLMDEKVFKDIGSRHKAVCLLQYLCNPVQEKLFEGYFSLPKVLCGLGQGEAIDIFSFSEEEVELAAGLLDAVISQNDHWKKLSAAGFRNSYLQRSGSLRVRDNHWLLQVQKETFDVTLQKLPWGYGTVSLPWMENILVVEW
ncbi:MAG: contractile injection system tape measure protein, partial [Cyclobacteriaceae bacterium]